MGIPLSAYVLGDAAASAPVFLLQLIVITPIALTILDFSTGGKPSIGRILLQPVRNPLIIAFGMSLHGTRVLAAGEFRKDVVLASVFKLALMPVAAWLLGYVVFGLEGHALFAAVILMALPAGQNVFDYAQRYRRGEVLARDVVFVTTLGSFPAMLVVAALLAPR